MSIIYKSHIINSDLSVNAKGGTELIRSRLLANVDKDLLNKVAIHFSRTDRIFNDVVNIFYAHDLPSDISNNFMVKNYHRFDAFVFVSNYQKQKYLQKYSFLPIDKCIVIYNCLDNTTMPFFNKRDNSKIKFIYHTTPHRGLELLYPIFNKLSSKYENIELDVFSSYSIYGWDNEDKKYEKLFDKLKLHSKINYHGAVDNKIVLDQLEKSHIFLYPCIWEETFCLAMAEAITKGCMVIHPDYGCLSETSFGNTYMYKMEKNSLDHANIAYRLTDKILNNFDNVYDNHLKKTMIEFDIHNNYNIIDFKTRWEYLIQGILNEKR